jgi:diguanylate cyclase (GGDEF)-like protein/PAS domain S-box-containing protein
MASGIVLIERSATLNHLVQRTLSASAVAPDAIINSYGEAAAHIGSHDVHAVILGAPQRSSPEFEALLSFLKVGAGSKVPVLLMANEKTPQLSTWLADRRGAQSLLWANFGRIPAVLKVMLPKTEAAKLTVEEPAQASKVATAAPAKSLVASTTPEKTEAKKPAPPALKLAQGKTLSLLFIDDSQSVRFAYRQLLHKQGYEVDVAGSVEEGVNKALKGTFDLIICDYYLPDGTGDQLVKRIKADEATKNTPVAMITGTYKDQIIKACLDAGAVECMFKNEVLDLTLARINALARSVQVQKHIDTERQRLDGILGSVGDGVYGVDDDGAVTFANPMTSKILGYVDESELIGKSAHQGFHFAAEDGARLSELDSPISKAYASGERLSGFETVFWTRAGEAVPVECTVVPLSISHQRKGSVVVFRNISERKSADRLRWELNHDVLTGLANRRYFIQALAQEIESRRERSGYSAVLFIDLDRFSIVEEQIGAEASRSLLVDIGQRLNERLREGDMLARLQEDHYALLLTNVQLENLFTIADGFRELLHGVSYRRVNSGVLGSPIGITATVGVAVIGRDTPSAEYAIEHARVACTLGKRRGSDQTQIYVSDSDAKIARELDQGWSVRIRDALKDQRFVLLCQPIVGMQKISGEADFIARQGFRVNPHDHGEVILELLIRMINRDGQWISPTVFVPLAERVGLMHKIDLWVVSQAIKTLSANSTPARVCFTVNLSNLTLQDPESIKQIEDLLSEQPDIGARIIFEVTETRELGSLHSARRAIQALRKLGCRFALDDFGTGFSSISHLKHLPVDFVKIEGSFISGLSESETDRTMVASITALAHALGLKVMAEHVATGASLRWLKECGVDYSQGHYLGEPKPMIDVDFADLLK